MKRDRLLILFSLYLSIIGYLVYSIFEVGYEATTLRILAILPLAFLITSVFMSYKSRIDFLMPEIYVGLSLLIGTTLRTIWLTRPAILDYNKHQAVLLGQDITELYFPLFLINICVIFFLVGKQIKFDYFKIKIMDNIIIIKKFNFFMMVVFGCLTSIIGIYFLIKQVGITEILVENISGKKRIFDQSGQRYSFAWIRVFGKFSKFTFYLGILYFLIFRSSYSKNKMIRLLIIFSLATTILYSFVNSSRSVLIEIIIISTLSYIISEKKIPKLLSVGFIALTILLSGLIISKREGNETDYNNSLFHSSLESIVANNNFLGVSKTGKISKYVLKNNFYYFGQTYATWLYAPIPRTLWNEKPPVTPGLIVRKDIIGWASVNNLGGGIPPGIVAESFMNFGLLGVILVPLLLGSFVNFIFNKIRQLVVFNKLKSVDPITITILLNVYLQFTFNISGGSLTQSIVGILETLLILKILSTLKFFHTLKK